MTSKSLYVIESVYFSMAGLGMVAADSLMVIHRSSFDEYCMPLSKHDALLLTTRCQLGSNLVRLKAKSLRLHLQIQVIEEIELLHLLNGLVHYRE